MDKMELSKRLEQLVGEAAAQEGRLEMTQVLDHFRDVQMTPEEMEDVYLKLERWTSRLWRRRNSDGEETAWIRMRCWMAAVWFQAGMRKRRNTTDMARSGFWKACPQQTQSANT